VREESTFEERVEKRKRRCRSEQVDGGIAAILPSPPEEVGTAGGSGFGVGKPPDAETVDDDAC